MHSPTLHHMKSASTKNLIFLDFQSLDACTLWVQNTSYVKGCHCNGGYHPSFDACALWSRICHMSYVIRQGSPLQWRWIPSLLWRMRRLIQNMSYIKVCHCNWGQPPYFDACALQSRIHHASRDRPQAIPSPFPWCMCHPVVLCLSYVMGHCVDNDLPAWCMHHWCMMDDARRERAASENKIDSLW